MLQTTDSTINVQAWFDQFATTVASASGAKAREIAKALQLFSNALLGPTNMTPALQESLSPHCAGAWTFFNRVVTQLVPQIFTSMTRQVSEACLQEQSFWQEAVGDRQLPVPGAHAAQVYERAAAFELPADQYSCLQGLSASLNMENEEFVALKEKYSMASMLHGISCFMSHFNARPFKERPATAEELCDVVMAAEKSLLHGVCKGLRQLETLTSSQTFESLILALTPVIADPLIGELLMQMEKLTDAAVGAIPAGHENFLITRNIQRIKTHMFSESNHQLICGSVEIFGKCLQIFERLLADLAALKVLGATHCAKLKMIQRSVKTIRCYSTTMHGLNLILHRLPGKIPREKAAISRELLGSGMTIAGEGVGDLGLRVLQGFESLG